MLNNILEFCLTIDKLKDVQREIFISSGTRRENVAEHSWHISIMAMLLLSDKAVNKEKVIEMLLIHDLAEITYGDINFDLTPDNKHEEEEQHLIRLINKLPKDIGLNILDLWREFEEGLTYEARCAKALDKLQPYLLVKSHLNSGNAPATYRRVKEINMRDKQNKFILDIFPELEQELEEFLIEGKKQGYII